MELAERLNQQNARFVAGKNPEVELEPTDAQLDSEGYVTDPEVNKLLADLDRAEVFFDNNPQDRRTGLVCFVELDGETAWYNDSESRWE